jgi:small subunit ribosomal protein S13
LVSAKLGFAFPFFINNLNLYNFFLINSILKDMMLSEIRVRRVMGSDIKNLINIKSYRGSRHFSFLPVRGQRTRTNAGTLRFLRSHKERVV